MSDSSDTTGSDYLENDYGDEDVHEDNVEEWTDFEEDHKEDEAEDSVHKKEIDLLSKVILCAKHKSGFMVPHSCTTCATALGLIKDPAIVKKLVLNTKPSGSTLVSRYSGRCDTVDPTLVLSSDTIQNALNIFTKGVFKDHRQWAEVIKKYLCLPAEQHELLNLDIQQEEILNQFRKEPRFQNIFRYGSELAKWLKNLRLSNRPLFCLMERVNIDIDFARFLAEQAGISFPDPDDAPPRIGVNVPRNGRKVLDSLRHLEYKDIFPVPDISEFTDMLPEEAAEALVVVFENYRISVRNQFMKLYNSYAAHLNASDDWLIFYSDLYSNVDAGFREMYRDRLGSLFKKDIKIDVIGQSSSKALKDEKSQGLFGGSILCI